MVDMLTEKLLLFISTDVYGMLTRVRAQGSETGYDKKKWNVVPCHAGAHVAYLLTRAVSLQPKRRQLWGDFWTQQPPWPSPSPPTPNPWHFVQIIRLWGAVLCACSGCSQLLPDVEIHIFIRRCLLRFIFKEYLPVKSLLTYASEFLHYLLLFK